MGIEIVDGKGSGRRAEVDNKHRIKTLSTQISEMHDSAADGLAYSWSNVTYNYDAADTILLVKNTSSTRTLEIIEIDVAGDTATEVIIHCPADVTSPTGTAVTGVNLNRTSGLTAEATAIADETTNTQANVIWRGRIAANTTFRLEGFICTLGLNDSIAVDFVTDGGACNVTITGHYEDI